MGFWSVFLCCASITFINAVILYSYPASDSEPSISLDHVIYPSNIYVSASALLCFRLFALGVIIASCVGILLGQPLVLMGTTRFQESRKITLTGISRFTTFTVSSDF
jgi:hypothetical protein